MLRKIFAVTSLAAAVVKGSAALSPAISCSSIVAPQLEGGSITNITAVQRATWCAINVYITHDNASDSVNVLTWLPDDWNGRYQGTGGSGATAGGSASALLSPMLAGYAAGTTDAGLPSTDTDGSTWYNNTQLANNFAYQSAHDMTVVGKALAEQYYGTPVQYAYWNGCSTGGRQGYMEAQKYPEDYDGIYAASPAINYDRFQVAEVWPFVVQTVEGEFVSTCVLDGLTAAAINLCDGDDGALDGLIANPNTCTFDATTWVGQAIQCDDGTNATVTDKEAGIFNSIAHGPVDTSGEKLFSGMTLGTSYTLVASSTPFVLLASWIQDFVLNDPGFNLSSITYETFPQIFNLSRTLWNARIGSDNPDLSAFQAHGGKLLSWHGFADSLIGGNGTLDYASRVHATMGGPAVVDDFYRLFMAPGVEHCGGGYGATPTDPFDVLVAWVENGTAPETLAAQGGSGTSTFARNLCKYPAVLQYSGSGNVSDAGSWTCA